MDKNVIAKILIAVAAILIVGAVAFTVATKVSGEEPTTISSELVAPSVAVPTGESADTAADSTRNWNETETLVQATQAETTAPEMPDEKPGEVATLAAAQIIDTESISKEQRALLLVNTQNKLSADYVPHLEETIEQSGIYLEAQAAEAFMQMYAAARSQGLTLTPSVGYVSFDRQRNNHANLAKKYVEMGYSEEEAQALAARKIQPAGCSEHNAGLAIDFTSNSADFEDSVEYKWLVKNAEMYGFIERYTYGFQNETGVEAAPGHWRYVGSADIAQAINESGLSFEEWMAYEYPYWEEATSEEESTTLPDESDWEEPEEEATEENTDEYAEPEENREPETTERVIIDLDAQ